MGRPQPITDVQVSYWQDSEAVDYFDALEDQSDLKLHLLAVKRDFHHIQRYDDREAEDVEGYTYQLFNPDELTVDEYESMKSRGFEFQPVTAEQLARAFHGIAGDAPPEWATDA